VVSSSGQMISGAGQIIAPGKQISGSGSHLNIGLHLVMGGGHFPLLQGGWTVVHDGTVVQGLLEVVVHGLGVETSHGG